MALHHGLTQCMITWGAGVLLCCLVIFLYGSRRPSNQLGGLSIGPNSHPTLCGNHIVRCGLQQSLWNADKYFTKPLYHQLQSQMCRECLALWLSLLLGAQLVSSCNLQKKHCLITFGSQSQSKADARRHPSGKAAPHIGGSILAVITHVHAH